MATTVRNMIARLQAVDVEAISNESIKENEQAIVTANQEQLYLGQKSDGRKIGWYRSRAYAELKHSMNPLPPMNVPDLRLTGAFYAGMKILIVEPGTVKIYSTDSKAGELTKKYGGDIFGLQEEQAAAVKEEILMPAFRRKFKEKTGL